jgi:hypothetical protein
VVNAIYRIAKLALLAHGWTGALLMQPYCFKARLKDAGGDLLRVVLTPIALVGLELAAIYGIFNPYEGRKLYASIERALYTDSFDWIAPRIRSFQPKGWRKEPSPNRCCGAFDFDYIKILKGGDGSKEGLTNLSGLEA